MTTLMVQSDYKYVWDNDNGRMAAMISFTAPHNYSIPSPPPAIIVEFGPLNLSAMPYPIFPTIADAIAYYGPSQAALWISILNATIGSAYYTDYSLINSDIESVAARVTALETWRGAKATHINNITATPSAAAITILGIQVPTAASFSSLVDYCITLRDQQNSILNVLSTREMMA